MRHANIIWILVLLSSLAYASPDIEVNKYSHSFSLRPLTLETQACACGRLADSYIIENTGDYETQIQVNNNANIPQNFYGVTLNPGQKVRLDLQTELACNSEEIDYLITANNDFGTVRTFQRNQEITQCQNLAISTNQLSSVSPNSSQQINVELTNPASFNETYTVWADNFLDYLTNSTYEVVLPAFSQQNLSFQYEFPPELFGNYTLKFNAKSEKTNLRASLILPLEIKRDYGFQISGDGQQICTEQNSEFIFEIKNTGAVDNVYTLDIIRNSDYKLSQKEIAVAVGETEQIIVTPNKNKPEQEQLQIKAKTKYGDEEATLELPITVQECFEIIAETPESIQNCQEESTHDLTVKNIGLKELGIELQMNNPAFSLSDNSITLAPNSSETIELVREEVFNGELWITFASGAGNLAKKIQVESYEYCSKALPTTYDFTTTNAKPNIEIPIKNEGLQDDTYTISVENAQITQELTIPAGQTRSAFMQLDFQDQDFDTYVFTIFLEGENEFAYDITVNYQDKNIAQKTIDFLWNNPCLYLNIILWGLAIIAFLAWIFIRPQNKGNPKLVTTVFSIIVMLGLIIVLVVAGIPQSITPQLENDPEALYFEVYEENIFSLDLDEYFKDSDMDNLAYDIDGSVDNEITGNKLSIRDEPGIYKFTILATDGKDLVESPEILLNIKQKPNITFIEFILRYCLWLAWLGLLFFALFSIGASKKLADKPRKKPNFDLPAKKPTKKTAKKTSKKAKKKKTSKRKTSKNN